MKMVCTQMIDKRKILKRVMCVYESNTAKIAILCWEEGHVPRGLMQLESLIGNSTNFDTYPFEVRVCRIKGANIQTVLENPSRIILNRMISESKKMAEEGICAITTSCGFNAIFQQELTAALDIPVFTSCLLQVPFVHRILPSKRIGVVTAKKNALKTAHLENVGITPSMNVEIFGLENCLEWNKIFTNPNEELDLAAVSGEVVGTAVNALKDFADIGAYVLECTDLPPFSSLIRRATGLPVYDFQTMMGYVARSLGLVGDYDTVNETHLIGGALL